MNAHSAKTVHFSLPNRPRRGIVKQYTAKMRALTKPLKAALIRGMIAFFHDGHFTDHALLEAGFLLAGAVLWSLGYVVFVKVLSKNNSCG